MQKEAWVDILVFHPFFILLISNFYKAHSAPPNLVEV
jgi:hypothetical protein